jgi:pyruvate kinase
LPSLTSKDKEYLKLAIKHNVDFIAHSFVRSKKDILDIKKALGSHDIPIIAKIEDQQGVDNLDDILDEVYGVMVARGDMGIEIEAGRVPLIQKEIIRKCIRRGKPVIVATHMLESMMINPRPTRAEVSDVANAILDGASALMLSGETSVGKFTVESVQTMSKISLHLKDRMFDERYLTMDGRPKDSITYIAKSAVEIALNTQAKAIVVPSHSGYCARLISSFRPRKPILAPCFDPKVMRRLALSHGIRPTKCDFFKSTDDLVYNIINQLKKESLIRDSDHIVLVAGTPNHPLQRTNFIEVDQVKHILN